MEIINITQLIIWHQTWTKEWHSELKCFQERSPWTEVEINHFNNFSLWHEEDLARRDDIPVERVRTAKRNIDRFNQARNDAMEMIDDYVLKNLSLHSVQNQSALLHSETPGMMIDRLSIMALKEYHMREQSERPDVGVSHREKCAARVRILQEQQRDLAEALRFLFADLYTGRRSFKIYRQLKMYNDPTLNPQLYGKVSA